MRNTDYEAFRYTVFSIPLFVPLRCVCLQHCYSRKPLAYFPQGNHCWI